jgi:hypothetical protein
MNTLYVGDTEIQILPDPDGGQQTIRVQATPLGALLAQTLLLGTTGLLPASDDGFYPLPHTSEMDARVCALIEALVSMRYSHPRLLQLRLFTDAELMGLCSSSRQEVRT